MEPKAHPRCVGKPVENFDTLAEYALRRDAVGLEDCSLRRRIHHNRQLGRVDLYVLASQAGELANLLADNLGAVDEQLEGVAIDRARLLGRPEHEEHQW